MGGWLERKISPFCTVLKGINHTRANYASVIFQRITFIFGKSSDIENNNNKMFT